MKRLLALGSLVGAGAGTSACGPPAQPVPPDLAVVARATSPSGHHEAIAYTLSGGGAAGYVLERVTLGAPVRDQTAFGPSDVAQLRHADPLTIAWADDSTLVVRYGPAAGIDTVVARLGGVRTVLRPDSGAVRP